MLRIVWTMCLAAGALATFSPSGYVYNVFDILRHRLGQNGSINWALPGFDIELQRSDDSLSISFFRAYFQGLEVIELEDECSMKNVSRLINIECLAKFPHAIFTAYGNLRVRKDNIQKQEGSNGGVIRVHVLTNNLLFLTRVEQHEGKKALSFEPVSPPVFDVTVAPKLIPLSWEDPVKVEISKWSHAKFLGFLNIDIKRTLNEIVALTPIGSDPTQVQPNQPASPVRLIQGNQPGDSAGHTHGNPTGHSSGNAGGQSPGQSTGNSNGQYNDQSNGQPNGQQNGQPNGQQNGQPNGQQNGQPSVQQNGQPNGQQSGQPKGQQSGQPNGQQGAQPNGQQNGQPNGQANRQPNGQSDVEPNRQPSGQSHGAPPPPPPPAPS